MSIYSVLARHNRCLSLLKKVQKSQFAVFSSSGSLVSTTIDERTGVATLLLNRPPVNSLSLEMCQAISEGIKEAEQSNKIQSLVLASSLPSIFSGGLDLLEMHNPDPKRLPEFWKSFQQVYLDLYGSRLACIASIEGHAPAAGCMLALACDYRIMAATKESSKPTIGLNESKFGIVAPPWLGELMVHTIGHRQAEKSLALGILYSPEDALKIGLVDEVASKDEVLTKANTEAAKWAKIPPQARVASKMLTRKKQLDHLVATRQADVDKFVAFATMDEVQNNLSLYLESLKKK